MIYFVEFDYKKSSFILIPNLQRAECLASKWNASFPAISVCNVIRFSDISSHVAYGDYLKLHLNLHSTFSHPIQKRPIQPVLLIRNHSYSGFLSFFWLTIIIYIWRFFIHLTSSREVQCSRATVAWSIT